MTNIDDLLRQNSGIRLDIACGGNKNPGFVGIDIRDIPGVDIVHDLEIYPWPLPDESVIIATASHFVEHINPAHFGIIKFFDEVWRVMRVGGEFGIVTPHGLSQGFRQDPTHTKAWDEASFCYFDPLIEDGRGNRVGLWDIYRPRPWQIKYLNWSPAANIEAILVKRHLTDWQNGKVSYE